MLNAKQMGCQNTYSVVKKKKKWNRRDNKEWYLILPNDSLKLKDIAKVKMG